MYLKEWTLPQSIDYGHTLITIQIFLKNDINYKCCVKMETKS